MPNSIALIQTAFLGDTAISLLLAQQIHSIYPTATITYVCRPDGESLVRSSPDVDTVLVFDKRGRDRGIKGMFRIARSLQNLHTDLIFCLQRSIRTTLVAWLSGAPTRIGFETAAAHTLLTHRTPYLTNHHEIERNQALIEELGIVPPRPTVPIKLLLNPKQSEQLDRVLSILSDSPCVAIAPGSVWATKRWPAERYHELAVKLRIEGCTVVFIGGPDDSQLCTRLAENTNTISVAGKLDSATTVMFLQHCSLLVSNDSAPTHLATLAACPTVTIFGSTVPAFGFGPRAPGSYIVEPPQLDCRPCGSHGRHRCPRGTLACMHSITTADVIARARLILERTFPQ